MTVDRTEAVREDEVDPIAQLSVFVIVTKQSAPDLDPRSESLQGRRAENTQRVPFISMFDQDA